MAKEMKKRFIWLDELRGIALISMLVYHTIFQSVVVGYKDADILTRPYSLFFQSVAQLLFISIAGISTFLSHNNTKRAIKVLACAIVVTVVTYVVMPENIIVFGILHFLGVAMLLYGLVFHYMTALPAIPMVLLNGIAFFAFHFTKAGHQIYTYLQTNLNEIIQQKKLWIVGLPHEEFVSSDYFPIFPWIFLFFFGVFLGKWIKKEENKFFIERKPIPILSFLGRHTLVIYMIHIPVIWSVLFLVKLWIE